MTSRTLAGSLLVTGCVLVFNACGDGGDATKGAEAPSAPDSSTQETTPGGSPSGAMRCDDVTVPGHMAVDVLATQVACEDAVKIVGAAEGRGRAAYRSGGFSCTPSEARGGDTDYSCSMRTARITFRYGAA